MHKQFTRAALLAAAAVIFTCLPVFPQAETGTITGMVTDPTGAVVPGARVVVKNLGTNASREVITTNTGVYTVPNLPPANYQLTVTVQGFTTAQRNLTLAVGMRVGVDIQLQVGSAATTVEVSEAAVSVNTETQTIGALVTTKQMVELPTITRNPYALVSTIGNVSTETPDGRGVGVAINGQRAASTNILLDGTANNDEFTATTGQTVPLDAVQELSVLTSNFTAEFGRATGGVINVATKSGTNTLHGTAYEFNRISRFASNLYDNNANGIEKPVFTRNQFGYSLGGPVVKNKLFFFSSTEWIRVRSAAIQTVWVPTDQFINAANVNTRDYFRAYGKLRDGLQILRPFTKADFLAEGYDLCRGLAAGSSCALLPSNLPLFNRSAYSYPSDAGAGVPQNTWMTVFRMDYNPSEKTQIFGRYALYDESDFEGTNASSPYAGFDSPNKNYNNSFVLSMTRTLSPTFVSQSKANFNRLTNEQPYGDFENVPSMYLGSANAATSILGVNVGLPGYLPFGPGTAIPFGGPQNYLQYYQDFSWIKGSHTLRFGGNYSYLRDNRMFGAYQGAVEVLGNSVPRGMEGFLNGTLYQFQAAVDPQGKYPCGATVTPDCTLTLPVGQPSFTRSNRYHDYALYAQDAWKVTRRITLNLGLRWEVFGTQHNKDNKLDSNYYLGTTGDIYQQIRNGFVTTVPNSPNGELWKTDYNNFAPRVGLAWDVFGNGRTSFRAGYGIGYERNFGNVTFNVIQNPPNYAVVSLFGGTDLPVIPVSVDNAGPLGGSSGTKALPRVSLRAVDPNINTAYAHLFSAAIEHRLADGIVAAVEYSGSRGEDQYGIANINRQASSLYYLNEACSDPLAANCRLRPYQYSNINFRTNGGWSRYNAMNLRLDWSNRYGLNMRMNYTWSHGIDTLSDTFSSSANSFNLGWLDPFNPSVDKGDAQYDIRQRFVLAGTWDVPAGTTHPVWKQVTGGWTLAPILTLRTGTPFSLFDTTNAWDAYPYAMFTADIPVNGTKLRATGTPNIYDYLNFAGKTDSSYMEAKTGLSGYGPFPANMIGRNRFRQPGFWNLDLGVYKSFTLTERLKLQLRAEAYNFMNHANLFANTGDADVWSTSYVSASYSNAVAGGGVGRQLQLSAKFIF